jgi:putative glutamine amidotransferase
VTRPLIGITSYAQPARWGAWELPAALVPLYYVESVERAGGRALVVPPSTEAVDETLDVLDGVVFSGGIDIDPASYGAERHPATDPAQAHRDAGELALLARALERDMPTLAICRGFQLVNVLRGGDLVQHLPEALGHEGHRERLGVFSEHPVEIKGGTRLAAILGERHGGVQSSHHQGIGRIGDGLVETAWAEDGSLEGLEDPDKRFAVAVLWHPEMEEDKRLFEALVDEAQRYRTERSGERAATA